MGLRDRSSSIELEDLKSSEEELDEFVIGVELNDISAAGRKQIAAPYDAEIKKVKSALHVGITTAGNATISVVLGGVGTAGTSVTGADITVAGGSTEQTVDYSTPTALNSVSENDPISIETDGGSTTNTSGGDTTAPASITLVMRRT